MHFIEKVAIGNGAILKCPRLTLSAYSSRWSRISDGQVFGRRLCDDGRTVLVVDDVMTTGSTLSECARMLKEAGAERVWCLTLCRSLRQR